MSTAFDSVQGAQLYIMNNQVSPHVAVVVPQLDGFDGLGGQKSSIPITNFDSAGFMEYAGGLVDPGKPNGNIVFKFNNATLKLLNTLLQLGTDSQTAFFMANSDGTAPPTVSGGTELIAPVAVSSPLLNTRSGFGFVGFINEFTPSFKTNDVVRAKFGVQASGQRKWYTKGNLGTA